MTVFRRRTFLTGSALALASVGGLAPRAEAADCGGPLVERFGVAATSAALVGMTVIGDRAYVTTRSQTPPLLAEFDVNTRQRLRSLRLTRGDGAWATTASNGMLYVGAYPFPDVYRFDPATGGLALLRTIGPVGGFVWCLTTAPDGTIYAGTYPRGEVWEYNPTTNAWRNFGQAVAGQQYVRGIAADENYVYAGVLPIGYLIRYDRVTGEKTDISPVPNAPGVYVVMKANERVLASAGDVIMDVLPDGSDARLIPMRDDMTDTMALAPDGVVYHTGRPSGGVLKQLDTTLLQIAAPVPGDEHRGIAFLDEGRTMIGAAGRGELWWLDMATRDSDSLDLLKVGIAGPEKVQSIALDPGKTVYVGGTSSITYHDPWNGTPPRMIRVEGEPKQMRVVGGRLYCAMYPRCEVIEVEPRGGRWRSYGPIRNEQLRPLDLEYDPVSGLLLMGTAAVNGQLTGALTLIEPRRGNYQVYRGVLPGQSVITVTVGEGIAYIAGDTIGVSVPPTRTSASIAAFDLATRRVLWEVEPIPGYTRIQHLAWFEGLVYGVYRATLPTWFVFDPVSRTIVRSGRLPLQGEVFVHRGRVFVSSFGGNVWQIGPDLTEAKLMVSGLGDSWYNVPQLAFEPDSDYAWALAGTDLARIRLDPTCLPAGARLAPSPGPSQELIEGRTVN